MRNHDAILHVRGESRFVDDEPLPANALYAVVVVSPEAHGRLLGIETAAAETAAGVCAVVTSRDVPGTNQIGNIVPDEPLLADGAVHFAGQPIALVVAVTEAAARHAARLVKVRIEPLPAILNPREAYARGELIVPQRTFALGDVDQAWSECDVVVSGRADSGAQEHVYLETQAAVARPVEGGGLHVLSATQSPTGVQRVIARVLGLPMHRVEVEVRRLGGGFGGKEDQATAWAALAALAAWKIQRPVRLVLRRHEDMRWTGKRHPYSSDFKIGLKRDGRIVAYEVFFHQNAGAAADLSPAVLERTLFHATNSYFIPNVRATAASCRTNLPPNTAFRGFGGPQGMFVMESAICAAAKALGVEPAAIQGNNLLRAGDELPYGMKLGTPTLRRCWAEAEERFDLPAMRRRVAGFNAAHRLEKKGLALMPVCFGIAFTNTFMNQAGALVHVYSDGSVAVSTAAVEMGQGTNMKLRQVAASTLGVGLDRIRMESTSTARVANTSPTAASAAPDLNGNATRLACLSILTRLKDVAAKTLNVGSSGNIEVREERVWLAGKPAELDWLKLVTAAHLGRINLSAQAHYATPGLHFDKATGKGEPFAYHAVGVAIVEATVDCLRGTAGVDIVRVVHDAGRSLNALVDRGQVEGGVMQGIGWMTMEEVLYDGRGQLRSDTLTTYKVPDFHSAPREMAVHFLEEPEGPAGILGAKTVGEPPFMYGIGAYFAVLEAMRAFEPGLKPFFNAPLTSEKILMRLTAQGTGGATTGAGEA
jgi:xanthine dehydrogenase large subunit